MNTRAILLAVTILSLVGCNDEEPDKKTAIRQEIAKREEARIKEANAAQEVHHTIRILIFALLAAGSVAAWMRLAYSTRRPGPFEYPAEPPPALGNDRPPVHPPARRVIDPPATRHPP